jgi:hypothetical protein
MINKKLELYRAQIAETFEVMREIEEEIEAILPKPLRVRIRERFKTYIDNEGIEKATKLLQKYRCKGITDLVSDDFEKFVNDIGGI